MACHLGSRDIFKVGIWEIEVTFRVLNQDVMGSSYHFWSKSMPELAGVPKKGQHQACRATN